MRWDRSLSLINTSIDQTPVPLRLIRAIKPDSWGSKGRTRAFSPCIPNQTGGRKRCRGVKFFWTFSSVTSSEKEAIFTSNPCSTTTQNRNRTPTKSPSLFFPTPLRKRKTDYPLNNHPVTTRKKKRYFSTISHPPMQRR
ncbi:hypothetical protein CDAR_613941 [Caerostris darwini]|uniref:Uncharacterized protein n=1 Tax=Caerostris darwini TaxID=1538125 RepID=A0AAV4MJW1_9ARAC|nr:hypothetical protein CDAR_613941 [Caerostris darwini]